MIVSLALTLIVLCAIFVLSNHKFAQANKEVEVVMADKFIPVGREITQSDITTVKIPERMAGGLVKAEKDKPSPVVGKSPAVSLIKGQYIWESSIASGMPQKEGYVTIFVPTDLASSACVVAGDLVNIHLVDKARTDMLAREPIYKGALVRSSRDSSNNEIDPGARAKLNEVASSGGKVPVCVGLDVPPTIANIIVDPASKKSVYLTLSEIKG